MKTDDALVVGALSCYLAALVLTFVPHVWAHDRGAVWLLLAAGLACTLVLHVRRR